MDTLFSSLLASTTDIPAAAAAAAAAAATATATAGQIPFAYRLTMFSEAVAYGAFAILWLFGYARAILQYFLSLLLKPILPFLTSPPARRLDRPRTAHASRGARSSNTQIHPRPSSHSRPSVTSTAGQFPLKRRPQPPWVIHSSLISSTSSTSSQETKGRRSTSMSRSCASAPVTPLKSPVPLDFSDCEDHLPRAARPSPHHPSSTPLHPTTHTDNEAEPKRGRARSIRDHSSRRILFHTDLRNSASNTRSVPLSLMALDSSRPAETALVFTVEPEELPNLDDILLSTAPRMRKGASWKSKLFSKPRASATEQPTDDAGVSPTASTPTTLSSAKEKENSFLRIFGTNKRQTTASSEQQSIAAAANDAEIVDPKKKSALRKFGMKASRKAAVDLPSPKDAKSPLPHMSTLSDAHLPSPTSPFSAKLGLKHAATFGPSSNHHHQTDDAPAKQQHPRNGPGHLHTLLHPIQACQAHLYNVHGIGSGPSTLDLLTPTPMPKGGVKRTDPYAEFGIARVPAAKAVTARRASAPSTVATPRNGTAA